MSSLRQELKGKMIEQLNEMIKDTTDLKGKK